jgi:hypothetical protein
MSVPEHFLSLTFDAEATDTAWYILQRFTGSGGPGMGYNVWIRLSDGQEIDMQVTGVDYDEHGQQTLFGVRLDDDWEPTEDEVEAPFWSDHGKPILEAVHVY